MKKIFMILCLFAISVLYANPLLKIQTNGEWIKDEETIDKIIWHKDDVVMTKVSYLKVNYVELQDDEFIVRFEGDENIVQSVTFNVLRNVAPNITWKIEKVNSKRKLIKKNIAKADKEDTATGTREGVSTASSRASESKEDFIWSE